MDYSVKPLSPELAATFTSYLVNLDFSHSPHWSTCFCRFYHTDCTAEQWQNRTGEENRDEAIAQIKEGNMKGYLAFDGEKCIGWCNANDLQQYKRLKNDFNHLVGDSKTGCVICFVIHPEYRKHGVARLLLKHAVAGFKAQGFDAVMSIPVENDTEPDKLYRGTFNMYKELGFEVKEQQGTAKVMLLKLR